MGSVVLPDTNIKYLCDTLLASAIWLKSSLFNRSHLFKIGFLVWDKAKKIIFVI